MANGDAFDVAPSALRPTRAAYLLIAVAFLFAAFAAATLERAMEAQHEAQSLASVQHDAGQAQARLDAVARMRATDPATLEKLRAQREVQRTLRISWTALFEALEHAARKVDGHVAITSLAPMKMQPEAAEVSIVGLALTPDILLQYVQALQDERHVKEAVLTSHQLAHSGGASVLRFHLALVWDPNK